MSENTEKLEVLYEKEIERIRKDPALYMTPGARAYFKRVAIGYIVLAVAFSFGIWGITNHVDRQLRSQLNTIIVENCKASIITLNKFNKGVNADIAAQEDALRINLLRGDLQRAALNKQIIKYKRESLLPVPTTEECEARKAF